jgi:hypothetical protein
MGCDQRSLTKRQCGFRHSRRRRLKLDINLTTVGPISDSAAFSIKRTAAPRRLFPKASMRPSSSSSCSLDDDRLKGSASVSCSLRVATLATVYSDVLFESRLQWPSRSSFCSREDHRPASTRQVRALTVPRDGHIRPTRPGHIAGLFAGALKTRIHTRPPFFSSPGWTIMEPPETRVTIANAVLFSFSMSWAICPSTSMVLICCSRLSPPVMKLDRS